MRTKLFFLIVLCALSFFCKIFAQDFDGAKLTQHPRLFLTSENEYKIFEALKANPELSTLNERLLANCEKLLKLPPCSRKLEGRRLLGVSREVLKRVFHLSWAYRFTKDERFAARAKSEMLAAANFSDWNPSHFLDVGELSLALAIGHDWIFETLTQEDKDILAKAISEKSFAPSNSDVRQYKWWLASKNNWNQVCNGGLLSAAISFYEYYPKDAQHIIYRSVQSNKIAIDVYEPDGAYPEGASYWAYGTSFQIVIFAALDSAFKKAFKLENSKAFLNSIKYMKFMTTPQNRYYSFGDCSTGNAYFQEIYPWFVKKTLDNSILFGQKKIMENKDSLNNRLLPLVFVYGADLDYKNVSESQETSAFFDGENPLFIVKPAGQNAYLAAKGGRANISHGHMDAGSFVFEIDGVRWSEDLGPQNYNKLEQAGVGLWDSKQDGDRWKIFRYSNFSHSTISIKDSLHIAKGSAPFIERFEKDNIVGASFDMTKVLGASIKSASRKIVLIDNAKVLTQDCISSNDKDVVLHWQICTQTDVKINEDANTITLTSDNKTLIITAKSNAKFTAKKFPRTPKNYEYEDANVSVVGFEFTAKANAETNFEVELKLVSE